MSEYDFEFVFKFRDIERFIYNKWEYEDLLEMVISEPKRVKELSNQKLFNEMITHHFDDYSGYTESCDKIIWHSLKEELESRLSDWLKQ